MAVNYIRDESFLSDWETNEGTFGRMGYKVGAKTTLAKAGLQIGDVFPENIKLTIVGTRRIRGKSRTGISADVIVVTAFHRRSV